MSQLYRSAIVTLAMGRATENLDYTFASFAQCPGVELHAFIVGKQLPRRQLPFIQYHLLPPLPDFSHPLREIYFRRMEVLDELGVDYAMTVDCFDVLCLQPLPPLEELLGGADMAACVEHGGSRYVLGTGCTTNFLNGGVFLWNVPRSRDIRAEVVARGRSHFRTIADDQFCLNEVILTKHFNRLKILPCQYNFRAYFRNTRRGWPTVNHLDGIMIYHNAASMDEAKKILPVKSRAVLPALPADGRPLNTREQFWRRVRNRLKPWVVK
jgi:hypothetical protein